MARQITVEILGDSSKFVQAVDKAENASKPLDTTWDRLQDTADQLSASMDTLGKRVQGLDGVSEAADAFGNLERVMLGVNDMMGVAAEQFGINLGPMQEYGQAAADVAGGMEGIIGGGAALVTQFKNIVPALLPAISSTWAHVTALLAQAAAFIVANAPILLIIGSIALLAAGVVLLVKNWDTIQPHVQPVIDFFEDKVIPAFVAVWEKGLKPVIDFVQNNWKLIGTLILAPFAPIILIATDAFGIRSKSIEGFNAIIDWMGDTWTTIKEKVTSPFDGLLESAKGAFGLKAAIIGAFEAIPGAISTALSGLMGIVGGIVNPVIDAYNNSVGRIPGTPSIPRFGGSGGGGDSRGSSGGGADPGQLAGMSQILSREGTGSGSPTGAYGNDLVWDPQGGPQGNGAWVYPWDVKAYGDASGAGLPGAVYGRDISTPQNSGMDRNIEESSADASMGGGLPSGYFYNNGILYDGLGHWWNEETQSWYNVGGGRYLDSSKWRGDDPVGNDVIDMRNPGANFHNPLPSAGILQQVIQLVVDGAVLAEVVNRQNGRGY